MVNSPEIKILFLGKQDDTYTDRAVKFCKRDNTRLTVCKGNWGDPLPEEASSWQGDLIISYLSRWIVPEGLLEKASIAAINFHPATPDYPGIGCVNFALYDNATEYGATCHHMSPVVDTGKIIDVRRFPVKSDDTVATLLERTYESQYSLFVDVMSDFFSGKAFPDSNEQWSRPPITRKEFNELCRITPDMSEEEIHRRIRATSFGKWQPSLELAGYTFRLQP